MREPLLESVEKCRVIAGLTRSTAAMGNNGMFILTTPRGIRLRAIASDGLGWEHVSITLVDWEKKKRCPTWEEMCWVKDQFWGEDETVIQYHPSKEDYVNCHPFCLHLWKPIGQEIPKPPPYTVGPKAAFGMHISGVTR